MMFIGLLLIGLIVFWGFRERDGYYHKSSRSQMESPLEILKRRYAEGTLTREEFQNMRDELNHR